MTQLLTEWTGALAGLLWGNPLTLCALVGTGLYLTWRLRWIQVRGLRHALELIRGKYHSPQSSGEVSHFQALSTALSGTIGTGNIAGVATAISLGGPGALFWMWITALAGMATKFAECSLALKFRETDAHGEISGGPMYTLARGLRMRKTGLCFAAFALVASFGIGNLVQANSVVDGMGYILPAVNTHRWVLGVVMAVLVGLVIIGGVKRIARVASALVPSMTLVYIVAALVVLASHISMIPGAFATILNHALNPWAVGGGAVGEAIRWGVARGLFSNEAGLGSSPMAHAAAQTREPAREGLVAMLEPFIDTLIICTLTGLVIIVTGANASPPDHLVGAALTVHAFSTTLGVIGGWIVGLCLTLFAFSTMITWSYYGDRSARFLFGPQAVLPYRILYTILVIAGTTVPLKLVWNIADITNILMALPNLLSLLLLAGLVKQIQETYWSRQFKKPLED